jgi:hAT family C-terminal dimerisation region
METLKLQRFVNRLNIVCLANQLQISPLPKALNVFDALPSLRSPPQTEHCDELARYLSTGPEAVDDVLMWWYEHSAMYPCLSRMALDYLTVPGASRSFKLSVKFTHVPCSYIC